MRRFVYILLFRDVYFSQWNFFSLSCFTRFSEFNSAGSAVEATKALPAEVAAPQAVHAPGGRRLLPKSKKTLPDFLIEPRNPLRRNTFQAVSRRSKGLDAVILLQFLPYK